MDKETEYLLKYYKQMKINEKVISPKVTTEIKDNGKERFLTTAEKAQYEVFKNGGLPKETIEKWIKQDLNAIQSFVHGILNDPEIFPAVVDLYYKKYQALHANTPEEKTAVKAFQNHESKRTTTGKS